MNKKKKRLLDEKHKIEIKIRDKNLDFFGGLILIIFFFWTVIGLILGIIFFISGVSGKETLQERLNRINDKLDDLED